VIPFSISNFQQKKGKINLYMFETSALSWFIFPLTFFNFQVIYWGRMGGNCELFNVAMTLKLKFQVSFHCHLSVVCITFQENATINLAIWRKVTRKRKIRITTRPNYTDGLISHHPNSKPSSIIPHSFRTFKFGLIFVERNSILKFTYW